MRWERKYWARPIAGAPFAEPLYRAPIDTTFALYAGGGAAAAHFYDGVRVGGRYAVLHVPWLYRHGLREAPADHAVYLRTRRGGIGMSAWATENATQQFYFDELPPHNNNKSTHG